MPPLDGQTLQGIPELRKRYTHRAMRSGTRRWQQGILVAALAGIAQPALASVTVTFQDGLSPPGYAGTRDVTLDEGIGVIWDPNANYDVSGTIEVEGAPNQHVALLRWDLQSVPPGSTVTAASLILNVTNGSTATYSLYQCFRPWVENQATWNVYQTGSPWASPGIGAGTDRGSTQLSLDPLTGSARLATFRLNDAGVQVVQGWVNSPTSNEGFAVVGTSTDGFGWEDSEVSTVANQPALQLTYSGLDGGVTMALLRNGTTDTVIASAPDPRTLNNNSGTLQVDGSPDHRSFLISFDLSAIPPWATVSAVALRGDATSGSSQLYPMYEALQPWAETQATWNEFRASFPWAGLGATGAVDHGAVVVGWLSVPTTGPFENALNDAGVQLVQDWVRGVRPNNGLLIQNYSNTNGIDVLSRETDVSANRPALAITYTEGQLVISPTPPIVVGEPSGPLAVERQRLDGVPIDTGAPALDVTLTPNSPQAELALALDGGWSTLLVVRIAPDASVSAPFFYRDQRLGVAILDADAGPAWVPGSRLLKVVDAGVIDDAGAPDAGATSGEEDAGGELLPGSDLHVGCGCSGAGASWVPLLALALLGASRVLARRR